MNKLIRPLLLNSYTWTLYSCSKAYGDKLREYNGICTEEYADDKLAIMWFSPNWESNARWFDENIMLMKGFFESNDIICRRSVLFHELINSRHYSKFGSTGISYGFEFNVLEVQPEYYQNAFLQYLRKKTTSFREY